LLGVQIHPFQRDSNLGYPRFNGPLIALERVPGRTLRLQSLELTDTAAWARMHLIGAGQNPIWAKTWLSVAATAVLLAIIALGPNTRLNRARRRRKHLNLRRPKPNGGENPVVCRRHGGSAPPQNLNLRMESAQHPNNCLCRSLSRRTKIEIEIWISLAPTRMPH
jgi:hypothetical protein